MATQKNTKKPATATVQNEDGSTSQVPEIIVFRAPKLVTLEVDVAGLTTLLCHPFSQKDIDALRGRNLGKKIKTKGTVQDPREAFLACFYVLPEHVKAHEKASQAWLAKTTPDEWALPFEAPKGAYGFPARAFHACLLRALGASIDVPMTRLSQVISLRHEMFPLTWTSIHMREDSVTVGAGRDLRYRSEWVGWGANLSFRINGNCVDVDSVAGALQVAGETVGIGDWRLEKKKGWPGSHGAFRVVSGRVIAEK